MLYQVRARYRSQPVGIVPLRLMGHLLSSECDPAGCKHWQRIGAWSQSGHARAAVTVQRPSQCSRLPLQLLQVLLAVWLHSRLHAWQMQRRAVTVLGGLRQWCSSHGRSIAYG